MSVFGSDGKETECVSGLYMAYQGRSAEISPREEDRILLSRQHLTRVLLTKDQYSVQGRERNLTVRYII